MLKITTSILLLLYNFIFILFLQALKTVILTIHWYSGHGYKAVVR